MFLLILSFLDIPLLGSGQGESGSLEISPLFIGYSVYAYDTLIGWILDTFLDI